MVMPGNVVGLSVGTGIGVSEGVGTGVVAEATSGAFACAVGRASVGLGLEVGGLVGSGLGGSFVGVG